MYLLFVTAMMKMRLEQIQNTDIDDAEEEEE